MTVSTTTTTNSFSGNGSTVAFAYTFKIFATGEMVVILRAATGTETVQTATTHYSVSGVGAASGGTVTFVTAPASGVTVLLKRASEQSQSTDYVENDPFPAATHEDALDKLTHISQELQEEVDRSIKLSRTNTMTSTEFTQNAAARASKVLAFDSSGELSVTQELGTSRGNWAASTAYVLRDFVKDSGNNNFYLCVTAHTSTGSLPISSNTDSAKWLLLVDAASATTSAAAAVVSAQLADDYAVKTSGAVTGSDYSSKAWSVGGTGVSTTGSRGSSKEWATTTGGAVDTSEYSAKEYALGTTVAAGSAKDWAVLAEDSAVTGSSYSALHHAAKGAASASAASTSATTSTAQAVISTAQAVISTAQAVISTTKAGEAATSATAAAASATAASSSAAAAEAVPMAIALG